MPSLLASTTRRATLALLVLGASAASAAAPNDAPGATPAGPAAGASPATPDAVEPDDYVRVRLAPEGPSPFRSIAYEVTWRAPATTAVHRRTLPGDGEGLHSLGLLTAPEADAIAALVVATDAMTLPDAAPPRANPRDLTWTVEIQRGGATHHFKCTAPENLADRRYQALIDGVRRNVKAIAGELPFRNVFFSPDRRGWVTLLSVPAARVSIDGFDTQLETPLYSYELAAGAHTLRLTTADGRFDRTYEIKVEPGGTTNLRVDLR